MKPILKVLIKKYTNANYIFMFEISPTKVIVIWFIKGSNIFKILIKYDFISYKTNNFHIFEPKVGAIMP
jgi:hypothetical protein